MENLFIYLETIQDEREEWKVQHKLKDIIVIVLFATLGNADDWQEITMFAHHNKDLLLKYIELENGIPSHDTIQRVFSSIKPEVFKKLQQIWNDLLNKEEGEKLKKILCLDGKTMRGNGNKNQDPLHVVSAWSKENGICFGQKSVNGKGKEIQAIKDVLDVISVKNQVVTIDAIGTQTEIVEKIKKGKGDYVLAVKGNQSNLHNDIMLYFDVEKMKEIKDNYEENSKYAYKKTSDKAHNQIEKREYFQSSDIRWLIKENRWKGLKTIGICKTTITKEDGAKHENFRYYISSLPVDIELFERSVRGHWSVEIMHWHLDVTFKEDANQTLDKIAAENLNIIRKLSLSVLKLLELDKKYSLKKKRFALSMGMNRYIDQIMQL